MSPDLASDLAAIRRIDVVPRILEVVCRSTGMGFAAVARVTEDRWIACAVRDEIAFGLQPGGELPVKTTICDEIRQNRQPVAIDRVAAEPRFCAHHTPAMYGFQSYISVPLCRPDGSFFGTLCAIDPKPAHVNNAETIGMFSLFADLIGYHLAAQDRLAANEHALADSRQQTELRDQLIAVLGHDLHAPITALRSSSKALDGIPLPGSARDMVDVVNRSAAEITTLVNGLMDFARGSGGPG